MARPSTEFVLWDVDKARPSGGPFSYGAALTEADRLESLYRRAFLVLPHEHVNAVSLRRAPTHGAALY